MNTKTMEQFEVLENKELGVISGGVNPSIVFPILQGLHWIGEQAGRTYYYMTHPK